MTGVKTFAAAHDIPIDTLAMPIREPRDGEDFQSVWLEHHHQLRDRLREVPDNTGIVFPSGSQALEIFDILRQELRREVPGQIGLVLADLPNDAESALAPAGAWK